MNQYINPMVFSFEDIELVSKYSLMAIQNNRDALQSE